MPYKATEAARSVEVTMFPIPIPWWVLALLAGFGGVVVVGSIIRHVEERKGR